MGIYSNKIEPEHCDTIVMPNGNVDIAFNQEVAMEGCYNTLTITSPSEAHAIRSVVNKAVDIFMKNDFKKGQI